MKFDDLNKVKERLEAAQEVEHDNREAAREAHLFVTKEDGQWEPFWSQMVSAAKKPRYTFDMTTPIVDQISGELEEADFDIKVRPAGSDATKDDAKLFDGMIRNIENVSGAVHVFNNSAKNMIVGGFDCWRVVQKYVDADSFDQDLAIESIPNSIDRVWFDPCFTKQDASDARYCYVLDAVGKEEYEDRWPEGSGASLSNDRTGEAYYHKKESVIIGQIYYVVEEERTLHLMSDGRILEDDDNFAAIQDELAAEGVTIERTRKRKKPCVYSRLFDNDDWLTEPQKTVFSYIPVVPTFGNFKVFEDKVIYRGVVQKLMDPQRVYNYSVSREIEEGALAPRAKYWMTNKQAEGHEAELATMNTNTDPVQFYNPDPEAPGTPQQDGGAQINPGLQNISTTMRDQIGMTAGLFAANMGDNPGLQSGVAIEKLQRKGDTSTIKYFSAQEIAIAHTGKIIVDAIPKVYDTKRQVRILGEDGAFSMETLNEEKFDTESRKMIKVNDLSKGIYDVVCSAGPAFQNKQQETVAAIVEIAGVDPSVIEMGGDVLLNNIDAPGMDLIAERKRAQLFAAGLIPFEQMTEEEKQQYLQQLQAQQQQAQNDPAQMLGQAELIKAQNEQAKTQISVQEKAANIQLAQQREQREIAKFQNSAINDRQKLALQAQNDRFSQMEKQQQIVMQQVKMQMDQSNAIVDQLKTVADTLKVLREAMGADAVVDPKAMKAYDEQADIVIDYQEQVD